MPTGLFHPLRLSVRRAERPLMPCYREKSVTRRQIHHSDEKQPSPSLSCHFKNRHTVVLRAESDRFPGLFLQNPALQPSCGPVFLC